MRRPLGLPFIKLVEMRRPLGLPLIKLVEMSYNLQSRTEYGVSDRAQIHPRAALAPARPGHAHDPKPLTRSAPAPSFSVASCMVMSTLTPLLETFSRVAWRSATHI